MGLSILFVDDEAPIRFAIEMYFGGREYALDLAEDLPTAESLLMTREYNVVITDLRLSGGSGRTEGLEIIRLARERSSSVRTILLTAYGSAAVEAEAKRLGVDLYLQKPISLGELERLLREMATLNPASD